MHALMGLGMAGMFALIAAWSSARLLRGSRTGDGGAAHLAIAPVATAFMYLTVASSAGAGTPDPLAGASGAGPAAGIGGHTGHLAGAGDSGAGGLLLAGLSLVVAGYFAWHAWQLTGVGRGPARETTPAPGAVALATRTQPWAHVVMSGLMATMFPFMA